MQFFKSKTFRWLMIVAFFVYLAVLFDVVFFSDYFGRSKEEALRYKDMNLIPFRTIRNFYIVNRRQFSMAFVINVIGNIAAFFPFGFLFPFFRNQRLSIKNIALCSLILSLFIEIGQGISDVGVMDVDDLILNVAGGILGYIFFRIIVTLFRMDFE